MIDPTPDRPLVTFMLLAYNQEKYIREAVEGAFSQTYKPLEIILSDDHSTDATFVTMERLVAAYKGPHCVRLLRNSENLGIGRHVNKLIREASGDWIMLAAGDDISYPDRTQLVIDHIYSIDRRVDGVVVKLEEMDEGGQSTGIYRNTFKENTDILQYAIKGAGLAVSRATVTEFSDFLPGVENEDVILSMRAMLLSNLEFLPEVGVRYRAKAKRELKDRIDSLSPAWANRMSKQARAAIAAFSQMENDQASAGMCQSSNPQAKMFFELKSTQAEDARLILRILTQSRLNYSTVLYRAYNNRKVRKALVWRLWNSLK